MDLIGGVVGSKGFVRPVQAFVFLETISVSVMSHPAVYTYEVTQTPVSPLVRRASGAHPVDVPFILWYR